MSHVHGERIAALYVVRNPDKLRWAPSAPLFEVRGT